MQPRPSAEETRPLRPRVRFSMVFLPVNKVVRLSGDMPERLDRIIGIILFRINSVKMISLFENG